MIETILTALAFGTVWFWIIAAITSVIFIASIENDHYSTPTITAIILGILYWKSIAAIGWQTVGIFVGVYALVGVLWSVFKWYRHCQKIANSYRGSYGTSLTPSQQSELKGEMCVSDHKSRLTGWIAWWPWSLTWGLTGDFFNMLYETMVNSYQKIADSALRKFTVVEPKVREVVTDADAPIRNRRG